MARFIADFKRCLRTRRCDDQRHRTFCRSCFAKEQRYAASRCHRRNNDRNELLRRSVVTGIGTSTGGTSGITDRTARRSARTDIIAIDCSHSINWRAVAVGALFVYGVCCLSVGGVSAVQTEDIEPKSKDTAAASQPQEFITSPKEDNALQAEKPNPADEPPKSSKAVATGISLAGTCLTPSTHKPVTATVRVFYTPSVADRLLLDRRYADKEGHFAFRDLNAPGELAETNQQYRWLVIATAPGHSSVMSQPNIYKRNDKDEEIELKLSDAPAILSGMVKDASGRPVEGANVFLPGTSAHPIEGFCSAVTDSSGQFEIKDLVHWNSDNTKKFDAKSGTGEQVTFHFVTIQHRYFPTTREVFRGSAGCEYYAAAASDH